MNIPTIPLYSLLIFVSCASLSKPVSEAPSEYLQVRKTSYRVVKNQAIAYFSLDYDIWFQDSLGITEIRSIRSIQSSTKDTLFSEPFGYRFFDMRKKWAYEYRHLSDTAAIIKKFDKADSLILLGGWNFFRRAAIQFDSLQLVGDTSINGLTYQKHKYVQYFEGRKYLSESLSLCDRKGTIFHTDAGLSNAIGCPVVKGTTLTSDGKFPFTSVEIVFISNKIPDSVQLVFAAWKYNVQKFPVE